MNPLRGAQTDNLLPTFEIYLIQQIYTQPIIHANDSFPRFSMVYNIIHGWDQNEMFFFSGEEYYWADKVTGYSSQYSAGRYAKSHVMAC